MNSTGKTSPREPVSIMAGTPGARPGTGIDPRVMEAGFRFFLQQELLRRCRVNPRYSLRAFARSLAIEPSALSKILAGKRAVTDAMFSRLAVRLGLGPGEIEKMRPGPLRRRSRKQAEGLLLPVSNYRQLTLDMFEVIADWYHYAILELTQVEGFVADAKWIGRKLGITASEAGIATERLLRLGFLTTDRDGRWIDASDAITTVGSPYSAVAFRKLQRQVLEKALLAIEETPMDLRDQSSMTMALSTKLLPEARERIKTFRRELCEFLKSQKPYDQVYHLGVSLYPVTGEPAAAAVDNGLPKGGPA